MHDLQKSVEKLLLFCEERLEHKSSTWKCAGSSNNLIRLVAFVERKGFQAYLIAEGRVLKPVEQGLGVK